MREPPSKITQLLLAYAQGDQQAGEALFTRVYGTLEAIAHQQLAGQGSGQTLSSRDLVHEAYLKLFGASPVTWQSRVHFFALAARAMRQIIIDYARRRRAQKRGGGAERVTLEASVLRVEDAALESLELEDALTRMSMLDPGLTRLVELRIFAGLSVKECAEVLGVSTRTVGRLWFQARALFSMILTDNGDS